MAVPTTSAQLFTELVLVTNTNAARHQLTGHHDTPHDSQEHWVSLNGNPLSVVKPGPSPGTSEHAVQEPAPGSGAKVPRGQGWQSTPVSIEPFRQAAGTKQDAHKENKANEGLTACRK